MRRPPDPPDALVSLIEGVCDARSCGDPVGPAAQAHQRCGSAIIGAVWFGILGPVQVRSADGSVVAVGGPRSRSLLALLLLEAGRVVSAARLIDGLYGQNPPGDAANALQSQVSRLRRRLRDQGDPGGLIEFQPAGYRLAVDPEDVDAHRFERLAREGRQALAAGDHPRAAALLGEALGLWRGPLLADVAGGLSAEAQVARLEELRLAAVEDRVEAELAVGGQGGIVAELQALVAAHPLRERLRVQLMRALDASGRPAEALAVFEDARRMLAEELGVDPSAELAAVHLALLRAEPSRPAAPPAAARGWLPAQLTSVVGRQASSSRSARCWARRGWSPSPEQAASARPGWRSRWPHGHRARSASSIWHCSAAGHSCPRRCSARSASARWGFCR
jgi:DNA-binding SARP family transcriptional activator